MAGIFVKSARIKKFFNTIFESIIIRAQVIKLLTLCLPFFINQDSSNETPKFSTGYHSLDSINSFSQQS